MTTTTSGPARSEEPWRASLPEGAPTEAATIPGHALTEGLRTINVDGIPVHLVEARDALSLVARCAGEHWHQPLAVASINLDHLHHFGATHPAVGNGVVPVDGQRVEWLNLIDGAPIAKQAERVTGLHYPKLSGSDLALSILEQASIPGRSVGFLGGSPDVTQSLASRFATEWPNIRFAGHWTPERSETTSKADCMRLASQIADQDVDILLVCLGKPRQELWIDNFGAQTGAGVLLAFGAVVDFLAGRVVRAPQWISRAGGEWAWRLAIEPRRLARRYLIEGPPAYLALRRSTAA